MKAKWTIGRRIGAGFAVVLIALGVVAVWSTMGLSNIVGNLGRAVNCNVLQNEVMQREIDHLKWAKAVSDLLTDEQVTKLEIQTDPHKCAFGKWYYGEGRAQAEALVPEIRKAVAAIEEPHSRLHASAIEIGDHFRQADLSRSAELKQRKVDHVNWARKVMNALLDENQTQIDVQLDPHKCGFGHWYYSDAVKELRAKDPEFDRILAAVEQPHNELHASAAKLNELLAAGQRQEAIRYYEENTNNHADEVCGQIDKIIAWNDEQVAGMLQAQTVYAAKTSLALADVQKLLQEIVDHAHEAAVHRNEAMQQQAGTTRGAVMLVSVIGTVAACVLAFLIARSIIKVLKRVVVGLRDGANQVKSAAAQVSSASQQLAEGASEQASSLEESSSALEEMAAMTRTNADNARQANELATKARQAADAGDKTMGRLNDAMAGINKSSDEISKIIKVIEEIAFQTNLLALNAAVEAARAGEHGKGFAVVADEVRNLAQRAAEAAKETTGLIEDSVSRSRDGAEVAGEVGEALGAIVSDVAKVTELVEGITTASDEQAQGAEQINTAVSQMDKVTQQNAASAEESASAAEQLSAQAETVNGMVGELVDLVGGTAVRHTKEAACGKAPTAADKRRSSKTSEPLELASTGPLGF